jgi:hypothetical protein
VNIGQFALADDFYLIGLDDRTGRPRLHAKALGLGTAAALLAELVLADHIHVQDNRFEVARAYRQASSPAATAMMNSIIAEPYHTVPTWLSYFAQTSTDIVVDRLIVLGFMKVEESRGLLRNKASYGVTDRAALTWRSVRIARVIHDRDLRTWEDLALIGLLIATGLIDNVLWNADPDDRESLRVLLANLNNEPTLHAIITQVEALIAAAVLAQRK